MMTRHIVQSVLLTGALVVGAAPVIPAQSDRIPVSTGVVATITSLDAHRGMATLKTEAGEVFALPKQTLWKVGDKVECDQIENGWQSRLQDCRPWR